MHRSVLAVALVAASPVAAGPFDGTYKQAANAECSLVGVDGGAVRIADDIFYGVEVECRMSDPVNVLEMDALLYSMQCSGEDQLFTERAMVMDKAEDDGIIMIWNGYAFVYDRCPEPGTAEPDPQTVGADATVEAASDEGD